MMRLRGLKPYLDVNIVYTGLRPGEKLYEELYFDDETTVSTQHSKVRAATPRNYGIGPFLPHVETLLAMADGDATALRKRLGSLVPSYQTETGSVLRLGPVDEVSEDLSPTNSAQ